MNDGDEAAAEDDHCCKMLYNDGCVGHEGPELVRLQAWVTLEVIKECCFVGIIVRD
jgi:hypothetical protein